MINIVTGASGFIGKHLMKRLDLELTQAINHWDLFDYTHLEAERLFYLATYGNLSSHTDWTNILRANTVEPIQMVSRFTGKFIFVSTSSVNLPVQTPYSRTKAATEQVLLSMIEQDKPVFIVRPYTVIGVGEQPQHLIPTLIRSCFERELVKFYPHATHDFIDVEDFVKGLLKIDDEFPPGVYEFGRGIPITNQCVLDMVQVATERPANIEVVDTGRPYDTADWCCKKPVMPLDKPLYHSIKEMVGAYINAH